MIPEKGRILAGAGFLLAGVGLIASNLLAGIGFALVLVAFYYLAKELSDRSLSYLGPIFASSAATGLIIYRDAVLAKFLGELLKRGGLIASSLGKALLAYSSYFAGLKELGWAIAMPSGIIACWIAYLAFRKRRSALYPVSAAFYLGGLIGMWFYSVSLGVVAASLLSLGIASLNLREKEVVGIDLRSDGKELP